MTDNTTATEITTIGHTATEAVDLSPNPAIPADKGVKLNAPLWTREEKEDIGRKIMDLLPNGMFADLWISEGGPYSALSIVREIAGGVTTDPRVRLDAAKLLLEQGL